MSGQGPSKPLRIAALVAVLVVVLFLANSIVGGSNPKTLGVLLAAAAAIFLLGETLFWKAIDKLSELPHSDSLTASEATDLATRVNNLKSRLIERWIILFLMKAIAAVCAAWLLNQQSQSDYSRVAWLVGVGALTVSFPVALSFFQNWQQADQIKTQQLLKARERKELKAATEDLDRSPSSPIEPNKLLAGYTNIVRSPKAKINSR